MCVTRVVPLSERCGSIWKIPPWAQSFAWSFIDSPMPVRCRLRTSSFSSTATPLLNVRPRCSGTLLA